MALQPREKRILIIGGVLAPLVWIYIFAGGPIREILSGGGGADISQGRAFQRIKQQVLSREKYNRAINQFKSKHHIVIPKGSPAEQREAFVRRIETISAAKEIEVRSLTPRKGKSSRRRNQGASGEPVAYTIMFDADTEKLVGWLEAIRSGGPPVVFDSVNVRGRGRRPDALRVTLDFHTFIFEEEAL